jgi:hypothetical protein
MRVTDEVMERLRAVNTPTLANALDDLGFSGVMNGIQAVGAGLRCVGRCKKVSATVWEGQAEIVRAMPAVPEHGAEDDDELAHRRDQPSKSISRTRPVPVSTISSPRKPAWASRPEIVDIRLMATTGAPSTFSRLASRRRKPSRGRDRPSPARRRKRRRLSIPAAGEWNAGWGQRRTP